MVTSYSSFSAPPSCLLNRQDLGRPPKSPVTPETVARARAWRLKRLREQVAAHDCAAILVYNPVNIRYAFDYANMQIWSTREAIRYGLVFADGPGIMHEHKGAEHLVALGFGSFEDETGWSVQGKANLILDNLISSKQATPMIVVMDNGYAYKKSRNF